MATSTVRYKGTSANDFFNLTPARLAAAAVTGGAGYDTIKIATTSNFTFSQTSFQALAGVDALDFTAATGAWTAVLLSQSLLDQSDARVLTIVSGSSGIDLLSASAALDGTVRIAGTGLVQLDGSIDNEVSIADGASVTVRGGAGNDTIHAGATGTLLDGGAGNDLLFAGVGADHIVFQSGYGADQVAGFATAHDVIDLAGSGLLYLADVTSHLTDTANGAVLDLGNGTSLTLLGVSAGSLTAGNFGGVLLAPPTIHIAVGTTAAALNAIIASAPDGATIILDEGRHVFDDTIVIARDHLTLKGASETGTILEFAFAAGNEGNSIEVTGDSRTLLETLAGPLARGATSLQMADASHLTAGDTIYLSQANTQAYLDANGWSNVAWSDAVDHPFREQIVEVDHVSGKTVFLKSPLAYDMDAGAAQVYEIELLHGIHLSDLTVTTNLGTANAYNFINALPAFEGTAAIRLDGTYGATLERISVRDAASHSFDIRSSLNVAADDLSVDGAHNKGTDGNGYGLQIYETFDSSFTNLEIFNTRHAVLFSSWNAETGNEVHVIDTNRDVNFHGSPDRDNTVVVEHDALAYDPSQNQGDGNGYWPIVGPGGAMHAKTDIYGPNIVKFGAATGSDAAETIYGTDNGAYLNGKGGQDRLIGGAGNDTIVGGTNKDVMTGGAGADTYVMRVGDNYDTITDFQLGTGGDRLAFTGTSTLDGVEDLSFTQSGNDVWVRYGSNATVILQNHTVAEVVASPQSFAFDPTGAELGWLM